MSWRPYIVRPGDHLDQLAARLHFDAQRVWNDPHNASLRARRPERRLLCPGDVLMVPSGEEVRPDFEARQSNDYTARSSATRVKLVLRDEDGPIAAARCKVTPPSGESFLVVSGPDGSLAFEVPVATREVTVLLVERCIELLVRVGALDPVGEPSGVRQRLANLGYYPSKSDGDPSVSVSDDEHQRAIVAFRAKHRLSPGGVDAAFTALLTQEHGA